MQDFKFSVNRIDDHVERIGVDVRPILEIKLEKTKLFDFANKLIEEYPMLFESTVLSKNEFSMRKKFIFPGKGELDVVTLGVTERGLVLILPRKVAALEEETDLGDTCQIVPGVLKLFREYFPHKHIIRVGQVHEYVFDLGSVDGVRFLAKQFTKINMPANGELKIRVNRPTDDYNRIIEMQPVRKVKRMPEIPDTQQVLGHGLKVSVDFNNRDMSTNLQNSNIMSILYESIEFNKKGLYEFLNRETGGESE